jgi:hypothetical protein
MEIGWTDVGIGGYILMSCAHSNTILIRKGEYYTDISCLGGVFAKNTSREMIRLGKF